MTFHAHCCISGTSYYWDLICWQPTINVRLFLAVPHSALLESKTLKYGPLPSYTTHVWPSSSPSSLTHLTIIWTIASTPRQSESGAMLSFYSPSPPCTHAALHFLSKILQLLLLLFKLYFQGSRSRGHFCSISQDALEQDIAQGLGFLSNVAKAEGLSSRKKGPFLTTHLFSFYSYSRGVTETESAHWCKLGHRVSPGCIFYKIELLGAISQTTLAVIFFKRDKVLTEVQTKRNYILLL